MQLYSAMMQIDHFFLFLFFHQYNVHYHDVHRVLSQIPELANGVSYNNVYSTGTKTCSYIVGIQYYTCT